MEKINAWIFIIIGILFLLPLISVDIGEVGSWLIMLGFLIIGILKLVSK
jgi:hypothetical protein